jgi:hypothetical protein
VLNTKSPCETQRALLAEYLTELEKMRVAQREHVEILKAGMGGAKPLLEKLMNECIAARSRHEQHQRDHHC